MKNFTNGDRIKVTGKDIFDRSEKHIGKFGTILNSMTFWTGCAVDVKLDNEDKIVCFEEKQLRRIND